MTNRRLMMDAVVAAARAEGSRLPPFELGEVAVNCHHNYVAQEHQFGHDVYVTRKGAVRARIGDLGIIPGSMGARSYIVCCSHGAGRAMSRGEAKRRFSLEDHAKATEGIECRKDADVIPHRVGQRRSVLYRTREFEFADRAGGDGAGTAGFAVVRDEHRLRVIAIRLTFDATDVHRANVLDLDDRRAREQSERAGTRGQQETEHNDPRDFDSAFH